MAYARQGIIAQYHLSLLIIAGNNIAHSSKCRRAYILLWMPTNIQYYYLFIILSSPDLQ